jgi:predicted transcriptional regulator
VNYRRRLDIIADILDVTRENAKKTQIMFQANLSYKVLQKYLAEIIESSLICFKDQNQCYMLTDKGREFLDAYQKYVKTNKRIKRKLNEANAKKKVLEKLCSSK